MTEFSDTIQQKRAEEADKFQQISQTARIVTAINKQTETLGRKMDTIIELLKAEGADPKDAKEA